MNLGMYVARSARYWPDRAAVVFKDQVLTFRALEERSNRLAHALAARGLKKGDRVVVVSPNRPEIVELECALYKLGLVKVALNARLSAQEITDALLNAEPVACVAGPAYRATLGPVLANLPGFKCALAWDPVGTEVGWLGYEEELALAPNHHIHVDVADADPAVLHYTSGSTGKLKAAVQTVGNRMASLRKIVMGRMQAQGNDVLLLCGPITHASGMFLQPMLFQGITVLLLDRFQPREYLDTIEKYKVTMCFVVPAMVYALLAEPSVRQRNFSSLRLLSYGAAPMSPSRIREAWSVFGPVLAQGYGAGETTGGVTSLTVADHARAISGERPELLGSCGRAFGECDVQVLDDACEPVKGDTIGEICVRGPDVFGGYWRAPEQTQEAFDSQGWLRTGDLARVDHEGYIYIVDRRKDMLVSGGFNVYPSEIESVLYQHPAVYEVCVVGVPDDHWGEAVKAVVVLRPGAQATDVELIGFCQTQLADFKKPRSVDFVDHLPKNNNGKMSRKDVRERYWQGHSRKVN